VLRFLLLSSLLALAACSTLGARSLKPTHAGFSEAIATALDEQLLLNIVRLRYREVPHFLDVSTVTSQQSLTSSGGIGAELGIDTTRIIKPSIGVSFTTSPTIVMVPLQGEAFTQRIVAPMPVLALLQLSQAGWRLDRLFTLAVDQLNGVANAPSAGGPSPRDPPRYKEFRALIGALRALGEAGMLRIAIQHGERREALLEVDADDGHRAELDQVRGLLGLDPAQTRFRLSLDFLDRGDDTVALRLRSLLSMMFYLSQGIALPEEHVAAGRVSTTHEANGARFDWQQVLGGFFAVRSSRHEPQEAYLKVRHREHWFYIADDDLESKATFMLLSTLFNLQSGQGAGLAPALTLPVSR